MKKWLSRILLRAGIITSTYYEALSDANKLVQERTHNRVIEGPFRGMLWGNSDGGWNNDDIGAILLGTYEQELHSALEQLIDRKPDLVVNLGCAEGFYCVGLKLRCAAARVVGVDLHVPSLKGALRNARQNNVDIELFSSLPQLKARRPAFIVDVEGAEIDYLQPSSWDLLTGSDILVEIHHWTQPGLLDILVERFRGSHEIEMIMSGPRNPSSIAILDGVNDKWKWILMSERRPDKMTWLWMTARSRAD